MTMDESPDRVVVERPGVHAGSGKHKRRIIAWTAHVADCAYLTKTNARALPAPEPPYDNTIDCTFCSPNGEHRRYPAEQSPDGTRFEQRCRCGLVGAGPTPDAARNKLTRLHRPPRASGLRPRLTEHALTYTTVGEETTVTCACGEEATAAGYNAARLRLYRKHRRTAINEGRENPAAS